MSSLGEMPLRRSLSQLALVVMLTVSTTWCSNNDPARDGGSTNIYTATPQEGQSIKGKNTRRARPRQNANDAAPFISVDSSPADGDGGALDGDCSADPLTRAFRQTLQEIHEQRRWNGRDSVSTDVFLDQMSPRFDAWASTLSELTDEGRRSDVDRLCAAIQTLRSHWSDKIFPRSRYNAFVRERALLGQFKVEAAQYFEPLPFDDETPEILKIYRFSIYEGAEVLRRYYLEKRTLLGTTMYALSVVDTKRDSSRDIRRFDAREPTYWQARHLVLAHLNESLPPSHQPRSRDMSPRSSTTNPDGKALR